MTFTPGVCSVTRAVGSNHSNVALTSMTSMPGVTGAVGSNHSNTGLTSMTAMPGVYGAEWFPDSWCFVY